MKRSKLLVIVLAIVMIMTVFLAACKPAEEAQPEETAVTVEDATSDTGTDTEVVEESAWVLGEEPLEFSWYRNYDWYAKGEWASVKAGEIWLRDEMGVNVEFVDANGAAQQKLNTFIIDDSYPDVIQLDKGQDVEQLVNAGALVAVDEWLDKYPDLKDSLGTTLDMLRSSDGKLYQVPNWAIGGDAVNGNGAFVLNEAIYKELGSPKLETFDQLYDYLVEVKANYPDVIPMDLAYNMSGFYVIYACMNPGEIFYNVEKNFVIPEGDALTSVFTNEKFLEAVKFVSKLYREKLITQDCFTQTKDQAREIYANQKFAVAVGSDMSNDMNKVRDAMLDQYPGNDFMFIHPLHPEGYTSDDVYPNSCNRLGWNVNVITKDAEDPEAIFAFMNWVFSPEGVSLAKFGPTDKYWNYGEFDADGWPVVKEAYFTDTQEDKKDIDYTIWVGNTAYADGLGAYLEAQIEEDKREWKASQMFEYTFTHSKDRTEWSNTIPLPTTDEGIIYLDIKDIYAEALANAIFAQSDAEIDEIMATAQQDAVDRGLEDLIAYMQDVWSANMDVLGK